MIILHGDYQVASRNALKELIDKIKHQGVKDIVSLDGDKLKLDELKQALESKSLFATDRLIIIENLLTRTRSKAKDELTQYLVKSDRKTKVCLWEKKAVNLRELQKFPKDTIIRMFKISPVIFRFLDSIFPGNTKQMLINYHESLNSEKPELIFYMLCRRIVNLMMVAEAGVKVLQGFQHWQIQKLERQAKSFDLQILIKLHDNLYFTDLSVKTGQNILPLSSMLDLLIIDI